MPYVHHVWWDYGLRMTAIAAVVHKGKVYIGGDSAGTGGWDLRLRADPKVFTNGEMVMGFTSSFRMGQVLRYGFTPPPFPEDGDVDQYMVVDFINAVRTQLSESGFATKDKGQESGGVFIVGFRGRIFQIEADYQVGTHFDPFAACGAGDQVVLGALSVTKGMAPEKRLRTALAAAERHNASVRGPFVVVREP